jgi:hypothetical protein
MGCFVSCVVISPSENNFLMRNRLFSFSFFLCALTISACASRFTPFTQAVVNDFNISDKELKKVQFYVSDDIVLRRGVAEGRSDISGGVLRTYKGRKVEEIRIRRGTPGVFLYRRGDDHLAVSFEDSGKDLYLMFGPNPKYGNRYVVLASDWKSGVGYVTYGGRQYETESNLSYLTVDMRRREQIEAKRRTAGGRRID